MTKQDTVMIESQRHRETLTKLACVHTENAAYWAEQGRRHPVDSKPHNKLRQEQEQLIADALTYALRAMEERDQMRAAIQRVLGDITMNVHLDARRWLQDALREGSANVRQG